MLKLNIFGLPVIRFRENPQIPICALRPVLVSIPPRVAVYFDRDFIFRHGQRSGVLLCIPPFNLRIALSGVETPTVKCVFDGPVFSFLQKVRPIDIWSFCPRKCLDTWSAPKIILPVWKSPPPPLSEESPFSSAESIASPSAKSRWAPEEPQIAPGRAIRPIPINFHSSDRENRPPASVNAPFRRPFRVEFQF